MTRIQHEIGWEVVYLVYAIRGLVSSSLAIASYHILFYIGNLIVL